MDEEQKEWMEKTFGQMSESVFFLALYTNNWLEDSGCLIQFALAILLDKPLFLLIEKGTKISKHLIRILEGYEFYEPEDMESTKQASLRLSKKMDKFLAEKR